MPQQRSRGVPVFDPTDLDSDARTHSIYTHSIERGNDAFDRSFIALASAILISTMWSSCVRNFKKPNKFIVDALSSKLRCSCRAHSIPSCSTSIRRFANNARTMTIMGCATNKKSVCLKAKKRLRWSQSDAFISDPKSIARRRKNN